MNDTTTTEELLIIVDFDGCRESGIYRVYPANEASEPDCDFWSEFIYDRAPSSDEYSTQSDARNAAHAEASRLAKHIGGNWATNE